MSCYSPPKPLKWLRRGCSTGSAAPGALPAAGRVAPALPAEIEEFLLASNGARFDGMSFEGVGGWM